MAFTPRHGKNAHFTMSNAAGSTVTFSSGLNDSNIDRAVDLAEKTAFQEADKTFLPGLRGATLSFSGNYTSTQVKDLHAALGHSTSLTWVYGPEDNTSGNQKFSGACYIDSVSVKAPVGDKATVDFSVTVDGAVTVGTY